MLNLILNQITAALIMGNYSPAIIERWETERAFDPKSHWHMYMYNVYSIASFLRAVCGVNNDTEDQIVLNATQLVINEMEENHQANMADIMLEL